MFSGNTVDRSDYRYGLGAVTTSGAGYALMASGLSVGQTDLTKNTFVLGLWVWIQDHTLYNASGVNGQVEISSNPSYDAEELCWEIGSIFKNLEDGWNWVVLKGVDGNISGGTPDFDNLSRFRIYVNNISNSVLKIDRVTITNINDTAGMAVPDWEAEISTSGQFSGSNGQDSRNNTFLDADLSEPSEITETVVEPGTPGTGCKKNANAAGLLIAAFPLLLFKRKRA
jgi:hypothetical protein